MSTLSKRRRIIPLFLVTIIFLCSSLVALPLLVRTDYEANAAVVRSPLQLNTVMLNHSYKSSIDGATLPCSVYVPTTRNPLSLWVDLHAFGGHGDQINNWLGNDYVPWANQYGMAIISPWGRNYKGMYADAKELGTPEPSVFDDFKLSTSTSVWTTEGGTWSWDGSSGFEGNGCYNQANQDQTWKNSIRNSCKGNNYTVTADIREVSSGGGISAMGIVLRRKGTQDYYQVDLCDMAGFEGRNKELRVYKNTAGVWTALVEDPITWNDGEWYNLRVSVFQDCLEVELDWRRQTLNISKKFPLDPSEEPYREGIEAGSTTVDCAGVTSYGGTHQFDNFRVQNDFLYGEQDIMDCIQQFIEEVSNDPTYRIDPSKIFISGYSMGGIGTWNLGLHYPDTFLALHPTDGGTDLEANYSWIWSHWPDQTDPTYQRDQDGHIGETIKTLLGCEPSGITTPVRSSLREYSARYILENAYNSSVRIEQPEYDCLIPNTRSPLNIWLTLYSGGLAAANPATASASWANSKDVWQAWLNKPQIFNGLRETSGYTELGETPPDPNNIWDNWNYTLHGIYGDPNSTPAKGGAHGNGFINHDFDDAFLCGKIVKFFDRVLTSPNGYYDRHTNPSEVAYKTYDNLHNKAWWLNVEAAYPDQDKPALVRVRRDTTNNKAVVHAKNTKTVTLDIMRMGLNNTTSGKVLTIMLDNNTEPQTTESAAVTDTWNKTTLKLVGNWWPAQAYTVKLNDGTNPYTVTKKGTSLTISDIALSGSQTKITITIPSGCTNLLQSYNPGFESGTTSWLYDMHYDANGVDKGGDGSFSIDTVEPAHKGTKSARIKNADANASQYPPVLSSWVSSEVSDLKSGQVYYISAYIKTRALMSTTRKYSNGQYDATYNSYAGVGILWYDQQHNFARMDYVTAGINGSRDWTPVELKVTSPTPGTSKLRAKVIVFVRSPDNQGTMNSAWFDDVALRQ